jgi:uncharacterized protein YacL (UPF0231 family)
MLELILKKNKSLECGMELFDSRCYSVCGFQALQKKEKVLHQLSDFQYVRKKNPPQR